MDKDKPKLLKTKRIWKKNKNNKKKRKKIKKGLK